MPQSISHVIFENMSATNPSVLFQVCLPLNDLENMPTIIGNLDD